LIVLTIGLTGGIGTGKSEVARLLAERGARVVDADRLVHELYQPSQPAYDAVIAAFGTAVLAADGSIDRARLGQVVFGDDEQMRRLTDIVWPLARVRVETIKREEAAAGCAVLVLEAPLLLEAGWRDLVDQVWLVRAPANVVRQRLVERRGLSPETAAARIGARPEPEASRADVVIENDADLGALARRVQAAWLTLVARKLV
jgi:dephospho-CoA kinase